MKKYQKLDKDTVRVFDVVETFQDKPVGDIKAETAQLEEQIKELQEQVKQLKEAVQ